MRVSWKQTFLYLVAGISRTSALQLNLDDPASIRSAAATVAYGLQSYYTYNTTGEPWQLGTFPFPPYYWWEAGAVWGGMVDYWAYTGDTSYVGVTGQALLAQAGPNNDYMMPQFFSSLANDDQAFWGLSVMSAAEYGFPKPSPSSPEWLSLAQGVFDTISARWDSYACGGGLRWQIDPNREGYNYKNSVSNGALFQLAARLARHTGDQSYANWAARIWEWCQTVGLIGAQYQVYDGTDEYCNALEVTEWSYNSGLFIYGASMLYDYTSGSPVWRQRLDSLVTASSVFFSPFPNATDIMFEPRCELAASCNTDQQSFKAYLSRWMAKTAILSPHTAATISPRLRASALGAAASCSGGEDNVTCGSKWYINGWDGREGLGQQLSALEIIQANLAGQAGPPSLQGEMVIDTAAPVGTSVVIPATNSAAEVIPATSVVFPPANSAAEGTPATSVVIDTTTSPAEGAPASSVVIDATTSAAEGTPATSVVIQVTTSAAEGAPASSVVIDSTTSAAEGTPVTGVVILATNSAADEAQGTSVIIQGSPTPPSNSVSSQPTAAATLVAIPGSSAAVTSRVTLENTAAATRSIVTASFTLAATPVRQTTQPGVQNTASAQAGSTTGATTGPRTGATTGSATGSTTAGTNSATSSLSGARLQLVGLMAFMVCFGSVAISVL